MSDLLSGYESTFAHERRGYLRCRAMDHAWFDYDSNWEPQFGTPFTLRCERCGMERRDTLNRYGEVETRTYVKPDHYALGRDEYKPTRSEYRLMLLDLHAKGDPPRKRSKSVR